MTPEERKAAAIELAARFQQDLQRAERALRRLHATAAEAIPLLNEEFGCNDFTTFSGGQDKPPPGGGG